MAAAKKKKKWLRFLGVVLVIGALVGVYVLLDEKEGTLSEEPNASITKGASQGVELCPLKKEEIVTISFQNERFSATIQKKEDGSYQLKEEPEFPLNQSRAQSAFQNIMIKADAVVRNDADLAVYGLDAPSVRVTAKTAAGEEFLLNIGDKIGTVSKSGYYACIDGQTTVYQVPVSLMTYYSFDKTAWIMQEKLPTIDTATIVGVEVESTEFEDLALFHTGAIGDGDGNPNSGNWRMEKPYSNVLSISETGVTEHIANYKSLGFGDAVDYKAERLSDYGLVNPATKLTLTYEKGSDLTGDIVRQKLVIHIGDKDENGDYYVNLNGSPRVYRMTAANVKGLVAPKAETLVEKRFSLIFIHTISELEVRFGDTRHLYEMTHEDVSDENGQSTNKKSHFVVDGVPVSEESTSFNTFYTYFVKPTASWVLPEDTEVWEQEAVITLRYKRTDPAYGDLFIEYFPYDESFYAARINGTMMYAVDKRDIDSMIEGINAYVPD